MLIWPVYYIYKYSWENFAVGVSCLFLIDWPIDWLIDWLIDWCLMPTLAISQLYRGINKSFVNLGHLELHKQNAYKTKHDLRLTIII
jgi:hypothetical protein